MMNRLGWGVALMLTAALGATLLIAASRTQNGITLTWPDYPLVGAGGGTPLLSCEPSVSDANRVTLSGLPEGVHVTVNFTFFDPYTNAISGSQSVDHTGVTGGTLPVAVPYPGNTEHWPVRTAEERAIGISAAAWVSTVPNTTIPSGKWWVRCELPTDPPPDHDVPPGGCTPGYWRQPQHEDSWVGYAPHDDFNAVFGVSASFSPRTLRDALRLGGGGERALARHAVAGLLNAARPDYSYTFTTSEILAGVQEAYTTGNFEPFKDLLDSANNVGCPLD